MYLYVEISLLNRFERKIRRFHLDDQEMKILILSEILMRQLMMQLFFKPSISYISTFHFYHTYTSKVDRVLF